MQFKHLDKLISSDMPIDYWEDDQLFTAQDIVEKFSENDWNIADESLSSKNSSWKCRLIQAISEAKSNNSAIKILLRCLEDKNSEVVVVAVDNLRNIIPGCGLTFSVSQLIIIERLISKGGITGKIANELKQQKVKDLDDAK